MILCYNDNEVWSGDLNEGMEGSVVREGERGDRGGWKERVCDMSGVSERGKETSE